MNTPQNIKELKKLIKKYESITIEKIEEVWETHVEWGSSVAEKLTGFGKKNTCILCEKVDGDCDLCVFQTSYGCCRDNNQITYDNIGDSITPEELYDGFQKRAKYLKEHFKDIL